MEIWKDIKGLEGSYQVSNLGRVKSLARVIKRSDNKIQTFKERILKVLPDNNGYSRVSLPINGKQTKVRIHRLVAKAFIDNPDNRLQVNHIDGNKSNNHITNLEWCTTKENVIHAYKIGLKKPTNRKLTEEQILEIKNSSLKGVVLTKKFKVSKGLISNIKNNRL